MRFDFLAVSLPGLANKNSSVRCIGDKENPMFYSLKLIVMFFVGIASFWGNFAFAYPQDELHDVKNERISLVKIEEPNVWEFGIEITAHTPAQQIRTYAPVLMEWPEQKVKIVDRRLAIDAETEIADLNQLAQILQVGIANLGAGKVSRSTILYDVTKYNIEAPTVTDTLTVPKSVPKTLKPFLQESPYIEISHPKVKKFAASFEFESDATPWERVEKIYDVIRLRMPYEFDPQIRSLPQAIDAGKGDCEELTSLFIAVCRINKIPARAVWIPGHTYAEFYLLDSTGEGNWYPCQLAGTRLFGEMIESRPILQKGDRFVIPPHKNPVRYVAPQLIADGKVELGWVVHPVDPVTGQKLESPVDR
jgi:hypothetical protein